MKHILQRAMGAQDEYESHIVNIFELINKNISAFRPGNLLDVGCGNGDRTLRLAKWLGVDTAHIFGIDSHAPYVQQCQSSFNAVQVDLESGNLSYENDTFDLVTCNQVLEHLKNYHGIIDEIIRVTKSEGYIIIGIPNLAHLLNRAYLIFGIQPMCIAVPSSHVRGFTHAAFVQLLQSMPAITYIACMGSKLIYPLPLLLAKALSRIYPGLCAYVCYLIRKQ
ncbi:MAG: class I SAM-dependent methyltransferase [Syntrophales bacterium]